MRPQAPDSNCVAGPASGAGAEARPHAPFPPIMLETTALGNLSPMPAQPHRLPRAARACSLQDQSFFATVAGATGFSVVPIQWFEWRETGSRSLQNGLRARIASALFYMFYSFFCLSVSAPRGALWLNKKPAFDWQTRVFENSILICRLENPSHDASEPRYAVPNGHLALIAHGAQFMFNRGVHFLLNAQY
jgi:hypothetical protein